MANKQVLFRSAGGPERQVGQARSPAEYFISDDEEACPKVMTSRVSVGLLLYRRRGGEFQVLLVHPGGPYWRGKDEGAWQVPKGGAQPGEAMREAALREFEEEVGTRPSGQPWPLARLRQAGGKWVEAFAVESDLDPAGLVSNAFEIEWPPHSGTMRSFPEVDRAAWFSLRQARAKILASQAPLLAALEQAVPECRAR